MEVADNRDAVEQFTIAKIPTFVAFKSKEEMARYVGHNEENLSAFLQKSVEKGKQLMNNGQALPQDCQDPLELSAEACSANSATNA
jgi:thioredoxin-like negative regulator of GroEL